MTELVLDVRLDGFQEAIAVLVRDDRGAMAFAYRPAYLARADALALSLSLPLTDDPYDDVVTRSFFDNLLQERDGTLSEVMAREGLARDDVAGLLFHLGKDCAGALSVLPLGAPPVKVPGVYETDYVPLDNERLKAIVLALRDRRRLPEGMHDPSPLAGVQSKIALTLLPDGRFAEPVCGSGAPTTHILKVPDRDHPRDAEYEAAALDLSRTRGIETVEFAVHPVGDIKTLLLRRFDRGLDDSGRVVRLHQEDFAQALGLPAALKYERRATTGRRFDAAGINRVLNATADPVTERQRFVQATLFDLMIGNVDGHAKNFALLHLARNVIRVSPRYDLLPTRLDPSLTDELAFKIGSAATLAAIKAEDFNAFMVALGFNRGAARRRLIQKHASTLAAGLSDALEELTRKDLKRFADLIAANMRHLLPELGIEVPEAAKTRDAFVGRGGGWPMS